VFSVYYWMYGLLVWFLVLLAYLLAPRNKWQVADQIRRPLAESRRVEEILLTLLLTYFQRPSCKYKQHRKYADNRVREKL